MHVVCAGCALDSAYNDSRADSCEDAGCDHGGCCKAGYDICYAAPRSRAEPETPDHQLKNYEHEGDDVENLGPFAQGIEGVERGADFLW